MKSPGSRQQLLQAVVALLVVGRVDLCCAIGAVSRRGGGNRGRGSRRWGAMSIVIVYPLLVMAGHGALLAGRNSELGRRIFLRSCGGERCWCWSAICSVRRWHFLSATSSDGKFVRQRILRDPRWAALDGAIAQARTADHFLQPIQPALSDEFVQLPLRHHQGAFLGVPQVGGTRGGCRAFFSIAYLGTLGQLGIRILRGESEPGPVEYRALGRAAWLLTVGVAALLGHTATKVIEEYRRLAPVHEDEEDLD